MAIGWLLDLVVSLLTLITYTYILQAKFALFACLPALTRFDMSVTYLVVGSMLGVAYFDNGRTILPESY